MISLTKFKEKLQGSLQSLTMWFNSLMAGLPALLDYAQSQVTMLNGILPQHLYVWAFGATVVGNLLLRFFKTEVALEDKPLPQALANKL